VDDTGTRNAFQLLTECVDLLELAASSFSGMIKPPVYVARPDEHFEYENPDEKTFAILRCVRIASDFRAVMILLEHGHVQQVGVLMRGIVEFNMDLDVVIGPYLVPETKNDVDQRIAEYFSEPSWNFRRILEDPKKRATTPRRKTYALIAKVLGESVEPANPYQVRQTVKALEEGYSGYVHGAYEHIMELYDPYDRRFAIRGIPERIWEWMGYIALNLHQSLNCFAAIASFFGLKDLSKTIFEKRRELEVSRAYTE
jgi:hypothetical protein